MRIKMHYLTAAVSCTQLTGSIYSEDKMPKRHTAVVVADNSIGDRNYFVAQTGVRRHGAYCLVDRGTVDSIEAVRRRVECYTARLRIKHDYYHLKQRSQV